PAASARLTAALPKPAATGSACAASGAAVAASEASPGSGTCSCASRGWPLTSPPSQSEPWTARSERADSRAGSARVALVAELATVAREDRVLEPRVARLLDRGEGGLVVDPLGEIRAELLLEPG